MTFRGLLVGLVVCLFLFPVSAQTTDCEETLNNASSEFAAGHFSNVASLLQPCLEHGFTKEQQQRAYILLVQTYLILDDPIGAKESYLKLLKANPEYQTDPEHDPIDMVYLSRKFTSTPVFSVFADGGTNTQPVQLIFTNDISGLQQRKTYNLGIGFHLGGGIDWNLSDHILITGELNYAYTSYSATGLFDSAQSESPDYVKAVDHQHWIDVPVSVRYIDNVGDWRPYGYVGYALNFVIGDQIGFSQLNNLASESSIPFKDPAQSWLFARNFLNRSFFFGGGVRYKWNLRYLFADVRYAFGNTVVPNGKYLDVNKPDTWEGLYRVGWIDEPFRLDRLSISVGYVWPLYKPRELKKARTRGVLKKIQKQQG